MLINQLKNKERITIPPSDYIIYYQNQIMISRIVKFYSINVMVPALLPDMPPVYELIIARIIGKTC